MIENGKYFCDSCELPIDQDPMEVGYNGKKLLHFHPMDCLKNPDSHKCSFSYFSLHTELKKFPTGLFTISDLEKLGKEYVKEQLLEILKRSSN